MSIELTKTDLQKFNVTDSVIAKYKQDFMGLTISSLDNTEEIKAVHEARMLMVKKRTEVEKVRKELKADALEYGRTIDAEAKRINALLEPIESHLDLEENKVVEEKARLKAIEDKKEEDRVNARVARLIELGCNFDGRNYFFETFIISSRETKINSDLEFQTFIFNLENRVAELKAEKEEAERIAKEKEMELLKIQEQQKAESDRLEKIRLEQEAKELKIKQEQDKIQADKDRIETEKQAEIEKQKRAKELELAKKQAAEKALADAEKKRLSDEQARLKKIEDDRIGAEKLEAKKPDKKKLQDFADSIIDYTIPELKTKEARIIFTEAEAKLKDVYAWLTHEAKTFA